MGLKRNHQAVRFLRKIISQPDARSWLKDTPILSWLSDHGRYARLGDFPASSDPSISLEERVERFLLEILPPPEQPSRSHRRPYTQPSLLTRGLWEVFSQPLRPEELDEAQMVESLQDEINLLRVLTRRLFEKLPDDASSHEYLKYLEKISLMCSRIGRMYFIRHKVDVKGRNMSTQVILWIL